MTLLSVVASILLVGCGSEAPMAAPGPASESSAPGDQPTGAGEDPHSVDGVEQSGGQSGGQSGDSTIAPATGPGVEPSLAVAPVPAAESDRADDPVPEVPETPVETATSLSDLLGDQEATPLVTSPLPAAASASDRLVAGYPAVLRPTGSSRIETSSVSPSGDRLQVALVASTSLTAEEVLIAYRDRLFARGMLGRTAPPATPGSLAAAFRRGRSVVTLTVTPGGSRTTYIVQASLRAGRG